MIIFKVLSIILLTLMFLSFLSLLVSCLIEDKEDKQSKTKIPFNRFETMYYINPKKWFLMDDKVCYNHSITLYFSFIDTIRYMIFKKNFDKDKIEEVKNEQMVILCQEFQKDIEEYRDKNRKYIEEELKKITRGDHNAD